MEKSSWGAARNYETIVTMCIDRTDGKIPFETLCDYTKKVKKNSGKNIDL